MSHRLGDNNPTCVTATDLDRGGTTLTAPWPDENPTWRRHCSPQGYMTTGASKREHSMATARCTCRLFREAPRRGLLASVSSLWTMSEMVVRTHARKLYSTGLVDRHAFFAAWVPSLIIIIYIYIYIIRAPLTLSVLRSFPLIYGFCLALAFQYVAWLCAGCIDVGTSVGYRGVSKCLESEGTCGTFSFVIV